MDTDVVAAALLVESTTEEEAGRLLAGGWDLAAPAHWKAEFSNVVWKAVQLQRIAAKEIDAIISCPSALPIESVDVAELWRGGGHCWRPPGLRHSVGRVGNPPEDQRGQLRRPVATEISLDCDESP